MAKHAIQEQLHQDLSYNYPVSSSIITASDSPEPLLASSIPLEKHKETVLN